MAGCRTFKQTFAIAAGAVFLLSNCGPKFTTEPSVDAYQAKGPGKKVRVEAYLFDAKIRLDGKPTSLRLELFQTDSVVALGARGYLGKGALKGRLTSDSIEAFFPTRNEYLHEAVRDMLFSSSCTHAIDPLDFPGLLRTLPDRMDLGAGLIVQREDSKSKLRRYTLTWPECTWRLEMTYDKRKAGWRLSELLFDNGTDVSFTARRRAHKASTRVNKNKFELSVDPQAIRITP
ncbi:MAG: hypothetical protein OEV49_11925 [candidate division Zixibacteria bacterium]|nr:hypothetical protein [candidate division Zixibacteria bacterium]MDH3936037.1 hypothetical protein [candidate division Zixibacteria bacterium]MDH4034491.1 hypothetical protein [candidate division Zixibacteria bacterium]